MTPPGHLLHPFATFSDWFGFKRSCYIIDGPGPARSIFDMTVNGKFAVVKHIFGNVRPSGRSNGGSLEDFSSAEAWKASGSIRVVQVNSLYDDHPE